MSNYQMAERYLEAVLAEDWATVAGIMDPDMVGILPQSSEVFRGQDNYLATLSNYPGGMPKLVSEETHAQREEVSVQAMPFGLPSITDLRRRGHVLRDGQGGIPGRLDLARRLVGRVQRGQIGQGDHVLRSAIRCAGVARAIRRESTGRPRVAVRATLVASGARRSVNSVYGDHV